MYPYGTSGGFGQMLDPATHPVGSPVFAVRPPYAHLMQPVPQPAVGPVDQIFNQPPGPPSNIGALLQGMSMPQPTAPAPTPAPAPQAAPMPMPGEEGPFISVAQASGEQSGGGWWDKLMGDDKFRQALLRTGLQMMQPVQPGQSPLGAGAAAISGGADYLQQLKNLEKKQNLEERHTAAQERTAAASEMSAQAAQTKAAETDSEKALREAQAKEAAAKANLYDRSGGRNQNKLPATREDFLKQASLKAFSEFSTAEDIMNVMQAAEIAANRIYGAAADKTPAGSVAAGLPPEKERVVGKVYELPTGKFKWTGTGWKKQ